MESLNQLYKKNGGVGKSGFKPWIDSLNRKYYSSGSDKDILTWANEQYGNAKSETHLNAEGDDSPKVEIESRPITFLGLPNYVTISAGILITIGIGYGIYKLIKK